MGSFEKTIASAKLSHMEKYGFAYEEDLEYLKNVGDAKVCINDDGKKARITMENRTIEVDIKPTEIKRI